MEPAQTPLPGEDNAGMNAMGKAVLINMIILVIYTVGINLFGGSGHDAELGILVFTAFAILIHVTLNFIISIVQFIRGEKEWGKAFLVSFLLVLVVGFSTCLLIMG